MLHRSNLVLEFWDRKKELTINNYQYNQFVERFLSMLLKQDIGKCDITTNSLIKKGNISAAIVAKEDGILAGVEEFTLLNKNVEVIPVKKDGDLIKKRDILLKLKGNPKRILERERVSLNLLQRMSGIATLTNSLNKNLGNIRIAATRKTSWGHIDKKAVSIGNGLTHRLSLSDMVIIKDNHLRILNHNIKSALKLASEKSRYIEIEVENKKQALIAAKIIKSLDLKNRMFAIMLDKIHPQDIKSIISDLKDENLYDTVLLEASGNINPKNLSEYADCGVDIISMGYLTNSAKALDISQEIMR